MARTAEVILAELEDSKTKFDAYKTAAQNRFDADAATIADLRAQLANQPPATDLTGIDTASADLNADVTNTPIPA